MSTEQHEDHDGGSLNLGDMFTEAPRPPSPAPTYATYNRTPPASASPGCPTSPEPPRPKEITVRLVGSHPLWGHYLWNSARSFADFLDRHPSELCRGNRVLELGAGAGLPSLVAALNGAAKVVVTDYPDHALVANVETNVSENLPEEIRKKVEVRGYVWGSPVAPLLELLRADATVEVPPSTQEAKFDVILMSDLVFNHSQHAALLKTCDEALSRSPAPASASSPIHTPCLLVFFTHHRPKLAHKDMGFLQMARESGWTCDRVVRDRMEAMFEDDPGDVDVRSTVHGWILHRASE